jgi:hypothetical protein
MILRSTSARVVYYTRLTRPCPTGESSDVYRVCNLHHRVHLTTTISLYRTTCTPIQRFFLRIYIMYPVILPPPPPETSHASSFSSLFRPSYPRPLLTLFYLYRRKSARSYSNDHTTQSSEPVHPQLSPPDVPELGIACTASVFAF